MPKSGFRASAARRVGKQRHNPIARPAGARSASGSGVAAATASTAAAAGSSSNGPTLAHQLAKKAGLAPAASKEAKEELAHILSKLPLPASSPFASDKDGKGKASAGSTSAGGSAQGDEAITPADTVWALASVSLLAGARASRKALLAPQHRLVARVLHALTDAERISRRAGAPASEPDADGAASSTAPSSTAPSSTSAPSAQRLRHAALEVRREAGGALRNLCIAAGYDDVRAELGARIPGATDALTALLADTHERIEEALGGGGGGASSAAPGALDGAPLDGAAAGDDALQRQMQLERARLEAALPSADKPLEKMNRKERRHAAKAASLLEKQAQPGAAASTAAADASTESTAATSAGGLDAALASLARGTLAAGAEEVALLLEVQDNLLTVVWCLAEASADLAAALTARHAAPLARTLARAVHWGCAASAASASTSSASSAGSSLAQHAPLLRRLGVSAANALCALSDENPAFARVLAGVAPSADEVRALHRAAKGAPAGGPPAGGAPVAAGATRKQAAKVQLAVLPDIDADAGRDALGALAAAVAAGLDGGAVRAALPSASASAGASAAGAGAAPAAASQAEAVEAAMLTMLSAATLRNVAASLPPDSRARAAVPAPAPGPASADAHQAQTQTMPLLAFEAQHTVPKLIALLPDIDAQGLGAAVAKAALAGKGRAAAAGAQDDDEDDGEEDTSAAHKRADDALQVVLLALEILAEALPALASYSAGAEGGAMDSGMDAADEEEDEWLEDDGDDEGAEDAEMMDGAEDAGADDSEMALEADADAAAPPKSAANGARAASDFGSSTLAQAFAHPSLVQQLLRLSSADDLALAYPSLSDASEAEHAASARAAGAAALRQVHLRAISVLSNLLLGLAASSPPPPSQPLEAGSAAAARVAAFSAWASGPQVRPRFEELWQVLFRIASKTAEVPAVGAASPAGVHAPHAAEGADGRALVEQCVGSMWAIARSLQGALPLRAAESGVEIVSALQAAYLSAQTDAMRAKAIGTLSCLARAPGVDVEVNRSIGNFLINVVKQLPADGKPAAGATTPESMVAALNAIYDVYADENAHYDAPVFRQGQFTTVLRQCSGRVRATARAVDKRKFASLRQAADEANDNLIAFVQYRDSLKL